MSFEPPTLADFEDLVRQMVQAENRLRDAIGTELVLRRRCSLVNGMHHVIDRVTAECRAEDEKATVTITVPAQRTHTDQTALTDISDLVPIPQLGTFAHELRGATQTPKEAL